MKTAYLASILIIAAGLSCSSSSSSPNAGDAGSGSDVATPPDGNSGGDAPAGDGAGDTWTSYAQGFFTTYCVECHNPTLLAQGKTMRDFTTITDVVRDAATIRCGVAPTLLSGCTGSPAPKQFPINDSTGTNPKPSDAERSRIVAWIEAGAPQ